MFPFSVVLKSCTLSFLFCKSCQKQIVTFWCLVSSKKMKNKTKPIHRLKSQKTFKVWKKIILSFGDDDHFCYVNSKTNANQCKQYTEFTLEEILRSDKIFTMKLDNIYHGEMDVISVFCHWVLRDYRILRSGLNQPLKHFSIWNINHIFPFALL